MIRIIFSHLCLKKKKKVGEDFRINCGTSLSTIAIRRNTVEFLFVVKGGEETNLWGVFINISSHNEAKTAILYSFK